MSVIYTVFLTYGQYADVVHKPLRAFTDKSEAESYIRNHTQHIAYNMGKLSAVDSLMEQMWDKVNPGPTYPHDASMEEHLSYNQALDAHNSARAAELTRLEKLVEYDNTIEFRWYHEPWHLYLQEIPFGLERVRHTVFPEVG